MNINLTSTNNPFKGLIPKKNYTGVVLKLTPNDKKKIDEFSKKRAMLQNELDKLLNMQTRIPNHNHWKEANWCADKIMRLEVDIETLGSLIREVKINRLNKQKEKIKNLDKMV